MKRMTMVLAGLLLAFVAQPAAAQQWQVVVNAANPTASLTTDEVSDLFLKKKLRWADGKTVVPVDQERSSTVREGFSRAVHGRPASAVASYWQQQIFAGREMPPAERPSDAEVLAFVRGNPGAIGYVSAGVDPGAGVKRVAVK